MNPYRNRTDYYNPGYNQSISMSPDTNPTDYFHSYKLSNGLNNPTTVTDISNVQTFNEAKYFAGNNISEKIIPDLYNKNPIYSVSQPELTTICKSLGNDDCVTSSYCTLVHDQNAPFPKCVPGNSNGPFVSYSDINVDYYYFLNKCYGNCPSVFSSLQKM
jgi:hypothetical protein